MLIDYDEAVWAVAVQLAFEADMECSGEHNPEDYLNVAKMYFDKIEAKEEPKTGRWEVVDYEEPRRYGCSECKRLVWHTENYCPNCGARMEASDD